MSSSRTNRPDLDQLAPDAVMLVPGHEATPVDEGDVCVNYDIGWLTSNGIGVPIIPRRLHHA